MAQSTTEYIMMLVLAVTLAVGMYNRFLQPWMEKLAGTMGIAIEESAFQGPDFRDFPLGR